MIEGSISNCLNVSYWPRVCENYLATIDYGTTLNKLAM
jgi:hypothetical protein